MQKDDFKDRIKPYHNNGEITQEFLGGHTQKSFVRLDDNTDRLKKKQAKTEYELQKTEKDSLFFGELFRDLRRGHSNYVTYINDEIVGKKRNETYIPRHVSCLIKETDSQTAVFSECVGSRLANELGVPTVFNIAHAEVPNEEDWEFMTDEEKMYSTYDYVISADYVPWGYTTENLEELGVNFNEDSLLQEIIESLEKKFPDISKEYGLKDDKKQFESLKHDFVKQYLFRQFICEDLDFEAKNVCLLMSENGDFSLGPCFDMELLFSGVKSKVYYKEMLDSTLDYLSDNMPGIFEEFMTCVSTANRKGRIDTIFGSTLKIPRRDYSHILNNVKGNIMIMEETLKRFKESQEREML
jgi:hypothetical protein